MAYTTPYEPTQPEGSDPAKDAPLDMKRKESMMVERIEDLFDTDFTDDPMQIGRLGRGIFLDGKLTYEAEYDAGNSGATKTLDFVANGTTQKITLTANCVITIPAAYAGATFKLNITQNATGNWTPTFSSNVKYQSNIAPVTIKTASTGTIYTGYYNGTVWWVSSGGTGFNVS